MPRAKDKKKVMSSNLQIRNYLANILRWLLNISDVMVFRKVFYTDSSIDQSEKLISIYNRKKTNFETGTVVLLDESLPNPVIVDELSSGLEGN